MHSSHTALLALAAAALFGATIAAPVPKYATDVDSTSHHDRLQQQSSGGILDVSVNPVGPRDFDIIYLYQRNNNQVAAWAHGGAGRKMTTCVKTWDELAGLKPEFADEAAKIKAKYPQYMIDGHFDTAAQHASANKPSHLAAAVSARKAAAMRKVANEDLERAQMHLGRTLGRHPVDEHGKRLRKKKKD